MALQQVQAQHQQTRNAMEKLAAISGLEYSNDIQDWVSKDKLDALRKAPR